MAAEVYKNSPLIEAVFEIRFPAVLSIKCNIDVFHDKIRKFFPLIRQSSPGMARLYDFLNREQDEIIRVGIDRISYHAKKYGGGFAKFQEDALKHLQVFVNTFHIKILGSVGLRYVNHIPIVRIDGIIPIGKYVNFGYQIPNQCFPHEFELLNTILVVKVGDGKLKVLLQSKETANIDVLVLDFDFIQIGKLEAKSVVSYIANAHKHTKKIFENLISDSYRKVMRGE